MRAILFFLFAYSFVSAQKTFIGGVIDKNTAWTEDTIVLTSSVHVLPNIQLIIKPGVLILGKEDTKLIINGSMIAKGTESKPIIFSAVDSLSISDTLIGGWAGIHIENLQSSIGSDSTIMENCTIQFGKTTKEYNQNGCGGGVYITNYNKIRIQYCVFRNNYAFYKGAAICVDNNSDISFLDNLVYKNICRNTGAGIFSGENSATKILHNIFYHNICLDSIKLLGGTSYRGTGMAISIESQTKAPLVMNNFISNNIGVEGAIYESTKDVRLVSNILVNNTCLLNGVILNGTQLSNAYYINNTIANNIGSAMDINVIYGNGLTIINNLAFNNFSNWDNEYKSVTYLLNPLCYFYHNNLENYKVGLNGIDDIPMFKSPSQGIGVGFNSVISDWSLQKNSPCINAGLLNDSIIKYLSNFDLLGNKRINEQIDIGALEFDNKTNINYLEVKNFSAFPNPATTDLTWLLPLGIFKGEVELQLYNSLGQLVKLEHFQPTSDVLKTNITNLPSGIYNWKISDSKHEAKGSVVVVR